VCCSGFEPYTSNIYVRRTLAGEFVCVSRHLLQDLIELGLWTPELKNKIIAKNGSIQSIQEIPAHIRQLYKTVWEVSQKTIINMAADRGAYIDQSQSLNIHMTDVNTAKLTSMHFHAWKKGLKTGMYYLRTKPSVDAIKFTIDPKLIKQQEEETENFKLLQQANKAAAAPVTAAQQLTPRSSGTVAFEAATSGMQKLAVGSPVKQAPNPRGEVSSAAAASSSFAMLPATVNGVERTAEEIRAERARKEEEIRQWERDNEQGSCKGGMCSA
jgi:ribonucleotide reductase alpha subunit